MALRPIRNGCSASPTVTRPRSGAGFGPWFRLLPVGDQRSDEATNVEERTAVTQGPQEAAPRVSALVMCAANLASAAVEVVDDPDVGAIVGVSKN